MTDDEQRIERRDVLVVVDVQTDERILEIRRQHLSRFQGLRQ